MEKEETEVEETLVLVELSGIIDSNFIVEKQKSIKILGIESENPILQLDNYIFTGEYEDFKATQVIFEVKEKNVEGKDREGETELKYYGKTPKKLAMKRVFLQAKKTDEDSVITEEMSGISLSDKGNCSADCPTT